MRSLPRVTHTPVTQAHPPAQPATQKSAPFVPPQAAAPAITVTPARINCDGGGNGRPPLGTLRLRLARIPPRLSRRGEAARRGGRRYPPLLTVDRAGQVFNVDVARGPDGKRWIAQRSTCCASAALPAFSPTMTEDHITITMQMHYSLTP